MKSNPRKLSPVQAIFERHQAENVFQNHTVREVIKALAARPNPEAAVYTAFTNTLPGEVTIEIGHQAGETEHFTSYLLVWVRGLEELDAAEPEDRQYTPIGAFMKMAGHSVSEYGNVVVNYRFKESIWPALTEITGVKVDAGNDRIVLRWDEVALECHETLRFPDLQGPIPPEPVSERPNHDYYHIEHVGIPVQLTWSLMGKIINGLGGKVLAFPVDDEVGSLYPVVIDGGRIYVETERCLSGSIGGFHNQTVGDEPSFLALEKLAGALRECGYVVRKS